MAIQDPLSCDEQNPFANLNFTRNDYVVHFFTISPIPLVCLFSLYQSISSGAKSLEDMETLGVGIYFILSWILYPVAYLAIQFMASRKMNLRKASQQATSRITYKYFSVLVGYLLAIPLCPIGFTTISNIKRYQELKAQMATKNTQEEDTSTNQCQDTNKTYQEPIKEDALEQVQVDNQNSPKDTKNSQDLVSESEDNNKQEASQENIDSQAQTSPKYQETVNQDQSLAK